MENPFIFGETLSDASFIDREQEAASLARDLGDGQKVLLVAPRRFGKSALIGAVLRRLQARGVHTAAVPVAEATSYTEFLELFLTAVVRAAGPIDRLKNWGGRVLDRLRPELVLDNRTGEVRVSLGAGRPPEVPPAGEVFRIPGDVATHGRFRLVLALDEFPQVMQFGQNIEWALREAMQRQREVGYVIAGSQPSLMAAMLAPRRPFYKMGPTLFLERIAKTAWQAFIPAQFERRKRTLTPAGLDLLLSTAGLIPYDVQRLAHELWDHAELTGATVLDVTEVAQVVAGIVAGQAPYYERLWEQLVIRQRAVLRALTVAPDRILHEAVRTRYGLGAASTVQRALELLQRQELIARERQGYIFLDPFLAAWIRGGR